MRGGGGVDGAIHRAGGPAILAECIERFPHGLATGDAGWTTAGLMPARWVIHTVGPNYRAGQTDRTLLTSCYRRRPRSRRPTSGRPASRFPVISAGIFGWPLDDAVAAAVESLVAAESAVAEARIVVLDPRILDAVRSRLEE
ncbi:MAG: macro domain-containing protein [Candidatus Nanopelagicales bacterium]